MHVAPHRAAEELEARAARRSKPRARRCSRGPVLALRGESAGRIAAASGRTARAVQKRVARYNDGGAAALADRPGRGREPELPAAGHDRLRARIEAGPAAAALRGPDVRRIVRDGFGVALPEQATYDLLHRLDLSSLMPRPVHRKSDPEAQEAFKKGFPIGSRRSPRPDRPSGSRSGSPTRRGSAGEGCRCGWGPAVARGRAACAGPSTTGATR